MPFLLEQACHGYQSKYKYNHLWPYRPGIKNSAQLHIHPLHFVPMVRCTHKIQQDIFLCVKIIGFTIQASISTPSAVLTLKNSILDLLLSDFASAIIHLFSPLILYDQEVISIHWYKEYNNWRNYDGQISHWAKHRNHVFLSDWPVIPFPAFLFHQVWCGTNISV